MSNQANAAQRASVNNTRVMDTQKINDLLASIAPNETFDPEVREMLLQIADDFVDSVAMSACDLARHRKSNVLELKDVQMHLRTNLHMTIPGYMATNQDDASQLSTPGIPVPLPNINVSHKKRLAMVRKQKLQEGSTKRARSWRQAQHDTTMNKKQNTNTTV